MKEELKKLRSVMKRFEATQHLTVGKEIADIHCGRTFRITKVEKVENLSLGVVEEIYKKDSKAKPRKSIIIPDDWQMPFSNIRFTVRIKEFKDKKKRWVPCSHSPHGISTIPTQKQSRARTGVAGPSPNLSKCILHWVRIYTQPIGIQVMVGVVGLHKLWPYEKGMFSITEIEKILKNQKFRIKEILLGIFI